MEISQWYAVALGCVVALPVAIRLVLVTLVPTCGAFYIRKRLVYPRPFRGHIRLNGLDFILILAFLAGNAVCLAIDVKDISQLAKRSGVVSVINLLPLSLGADMNLIVSISGMSLPAYAKFHRWLGRVALGEGLIHVAAATSYHKLNLRTTSGVGTLTVCRIKL
jgi:hypothetical protein